MAAILSRPQCIKIEVTKTYYDMAGDNRIYYGMLFSSGLFKESVCCYYKRAIWVEYGL